MKSFLLFFWVLVSLTYCSPYKTEFSGIILDDVSGIKVPARIFLTNLEGIRIEPNGKHEHVMYLSKKWCYADGTFTVDVPYKKLVIEVQKGIESRPIKDTVVTGNNAPVTFRIIRWVDMIGKRYVSGDVHGHYELLHGASFMQEVLMQMKAEDLSVLAILANENNSVTCHFTGKVDTASTNEHRIYVGQEVRDWQMGHLTLLGLSSLVNGYPIVGGVLEEMNRPHWLMHHAMAATHKQGGIVVWSHFSNLPGSECPVAVALGNIDAIELMTFNEPLDLPSHWGPWSNSGMPQSEFTIMRGVDLYYQYLNAGFKLPIVAGTDKMKDDIPIGSNRYYAVYQGHDRYQDWIDGIKKGNGFITNGPLLDFTADGLTPGDSSGFFGTRLVKVHLEARSVLPFTTLEIVKNGYVVGHKTIFVKNNPAIGGVYTMKLDTIVELNSSSWISARVADDPDNRNRILPRGLSVFAHTNPVYFIRDHRSVRVQSSIDYLQKYLHGVVTWLEKKPRFENPKDRNEAIKLSKQAIAVLRAI